MLVSIANLARASLACRARRASRARLAIGVGVLSPLLWPAFAPGGPRSRWRPASRLAGRLVPWPDGSRRLSNRSPRRSRSRYARKRARRGGPRVRASGGGLGDLYRARCDAQDRPPREERVPRPDESRDPHADDPILGLTDELLADAARGASGARTAVALLTIKRNGEQLLRLINDILDVAKLESGKARGQRRSLLAARDHCQRDRVLRPSAKREGACASRRMSPPIVPPANRSAADPMRLRPDPLEPRRNAIKFTGIGTKSGSALSHVRLRAASLRSRLEIADTGIGLTLEAEAAGSSSPSRNRWVDGAALRRDRLGLAISRRYARLLGGDIALESVPDRGSVFRVTIPIGVRRRHPNARAPRSGCRPFRGMCSWPRTDPTPRADRPHLERAGLHVDVAANGLEARRWRSARCLSGYTIHVVLMGHADAGDDGRRGPFARCAPTATPGRSSRSPPRRSRVTAEACLAAGCDDYATSRSSAPRCSLCSSAPGEAGALIRRARV